MYKCPFCTYNNIDKHFLGVHIRQHHEDRFELRHREAMETDDDDHSLMADMFLVEAAAGMFDSPSSPDTSSGTDFSGGDSGSDFGGGGGGDFGGGGATDNF